MGCGGSKAVAADDAELKPVTEYTTEEAAAATKIQAGFRGHMARAELKKGKGAPVIGWDR